MCYEGRLTRSRLSGKGPHGSPGTHPHTGCPDARDGPCAGQREVSFDIIIQIILDAYLDEARLVTEAIVAVLAHAVEMSLVLAVVAVAKLTVLVEPEYKYFRAFFTFRSSSSLFVCLVGGICMCFVNKVFVLNVSHVDQILASLVGGICMCLLNYVFDLNV